MSLNSPEPTVAASKEKQRNELYRLLGRLPDRHRPLTVTLESTSQTDELIIEKLVLDINGRELVPAYFTRPSNQAGKLPVVLYNHAHFDQYAVGKAEFIQGRPEMQDPPYALALARAGYAGFCIDNWCFGERQGQGELSTFKQMLWHGQVLWGMMVYDNLRALDYLQTRPDIDTERIATMGMSMGSTMAWWLAALDKRIRVCIDLCCLTDYQSLIETNGLGLHGIYYYVPDLLTQFTTSDINALIAPRPHLSLAGRFDPLTPLAGLEKIDRQLRSVYEQEGAPTAWQLRIYEAGHEETAAMRADILAFLIKWM
ncbi:MAG TPA: alpha/beta hydrolase family protein [Fibrella sp.]